MILTQIIYILTGAILFAIGLRGVLLRSSILARILAVNLCGAGIFLVFVTMAYRGFELPPDSIPHALVLTGIVVAVSATGLAIALNRALNRRLQESSDE